VADGGNQGYFSYFAYANITQLLMTDPENSNGACPFGEGLAVWLKNSPGFNLDKVKTPVREEANSPCSLFGAWEWFVGLSRLGNPWS
jgi:hypothetical protein